MKNFNEFNRMNEAADPEVTLLENLFSFFYKKYKSSIAEVESNFYHSAVKLVEEGEISKEAFFAFCKEKGIITSPDGHNNPNQRVPMGGLGQRHPPEVDDDYDDYSSCGNSRSASFC